MSVRCKSDTDFVKHRCRGTFQRVWGRLRLSTASLESRSVRVCRGANRFEVRNSDRDGSDTDPSVDASFVRFWPVSVFSSPRGGTAVTSGEIASRRSRAATRKRRREAIRRRTSRREWWLSAGNRFAARGRERKKKENKRKVKRKEKGRGRLERRVPFSFDSFVALPLQLEIITLASHGTLIPSPFHFVRSSFFSWYSGDQRLLDSWINTLYR